MPTMTILEAAQHFGISKEAIHNRVRRGSLEVMLIEGVKMVEVDDKNTNPTVKTARARKAPAKKAVDERYYKFIEDQNAQLQLKVEKLEGETRTLREQKEAMLIDERIKIEQIYKEKDEQLKNILSTISSQFMLGAPAQEEEHVEVEIDDNPSTKSELISVKKYLKSKNLSDKKKIKIKARFAKKAKKDERIVTIGTKHYINTFKYDYSDLMK